MLVAVLAEDEALRAQLVSVLEDEGCDVLAPVPGPGWRPDGPLALAVAEVTETVMGVLEEIGTRSLLIGEPELRLALRVGAADCLPKPVHVEDLLPAVRRLLAPPEDFRRVTMAALEALARSLGVEVGAARLAARLAREAGVDPDTAAMVTLLTSMHQPGLIEALPASLRRLVVEVEDLWGSKAPGSPSPEAGVVMLARVARALDSVSQPGWFSATLLQALERVRQDGAGAARRRPEQGHRRRSLLSLARSLEAGGDREGAERAWRDVLADGEPSREGVEALLALARREPRRAAEAVAMAGRLSRVVAAETALEAGLLLADADAGGVEEMLRSAASELEALRLPGAAARARLALALERPDAQVEEPLALLLQPDHREELGRAAPWLLPLLLERAGATPSEARALRRLARESPDLERLLEAEVPVESRRAVAEALSGARSPWARKVLERLARDPDPEVRRRAEQAQPAEGPPALRIRTLGGFEVLRGDEPVPEGEWQSRNVRHLLAYLARARRPVQSGRVLEDFWPDQGGAARKNLNWAVSVLRRCLKPLDPVVRQGRSLELNPEVPRWHDLDELEAELVRMEEGREALAAGRRALALYRGPYLEDCYLDWALDARNQLELRVLAAARRLGGLALEQGHPGEALEAGSRVLEIDPCEQEGYLLLMRANRMLGRPEESLRHFEACSRMLRHEMGLEPRLDLLRERQWALMERE